MKGRRLCAWLMAFVMLFAEIGSVRVYAQEDAVIEEAADEAEETVIGSGAGEAGDVIVEEADDPAEDEVNEEAQDGRDDLELTKLPTHLYIKGVNILTEELRGKKLNNKLEVTDAKKGYLQYMKGTLILNEISLGGLLPNETGNMAVIIADGDLNIGVIGENNLTLLGSRDSQEMTGIYVDGDLLIGSVATSTGGRMGTISEPAKLTIGVPELGLHDPGLGGYKGQWKSSINCTGNITFMGAEGKVISNTPELKVMCAGYPEESTVSDYEVYAEGNISVEGATVSVKGTGGAKKCAAVYCEGDVSVTSGKLTAVSGKCGAYADGECIGINCKDGTLSVGRYGEVSAKGIKDDQGVGINCSNAEISGIVTAEGGFMAISSSAAAGGISLDGTYVAEPEEGIVKDSGVLSSVYYKNGTNTAKKALIHYGQLYDLWIGNSRVGTHNLKKLPNLNGTTTGSKFDPETNTLTLKGVTGINGYHEKNSIIGSIFSEIPLNIRGKGTIEITGILNAAAIYASAPLDIEGEFNLIGEKNAICVEKGVRIGGIGTVLNAEGGLYGVFNSSSSSSEPLVIEDGTITVSGNSADALWSSGLLELLGGDITADYTSGAHHDWYEALGSDNPLVIDEHMVLVLPADGKQKKIGDGTTYYTICASGEDYGAQKVHLVSSIHNIAMTQADAEYGTVLEDPVFDRIAGTDTPVIRYEGTLGNGEAYPKTAIKPTRVGEYTVSVIQKKDGEEWRCSADFSITPKKVTVRVKAIDREYNGDVNVALSEKPADQVVIGAEDDDVVGVVFTGATATIAKPDVSENAAVTVKGLTLGGMHAYNYALASQPAGVTVNITKAEMKAEAITVEVDRGKAGTKDLKEYIAEGGSCGAVEIKECADQLTDAGAKVTDGVLSWETKAGLSEIKVVLSIPVTGAKNYKDYALEVILFMDCKDVQSVSLNLTEVTLDMGGSAELIAYITPDSASEKSVEWKSGDELVAIVNAAGVVTAVKKGTTEITVTTKDGGKTAKCKVTVTEKCVGDTDKITRISPEDVDAYVIPQQKSVSVETSKAVKLSNGESVKVSISINYTNAVTYTGKAIKPDEAPISAKVDSTDLIKKAGLEGKATEGLFKISFKAKKNKNASKKVDEASFYAVIKVNKSVQKSLGLDKKQKADLAKLVKTVNKALKASPCKFTINKASLADYAGSLELNVKGKDGKIKVKNGKLKNLKNVKYKAAPDATKLSTLSKSNYTAIEPDEATNSVKIKGKTNFTGSVRLEPKKQ